MIYIIDIFSVSDILNWYIWWDGTRQQEWSLCQGFSLIYLIYLTYLTYLTYLIDLFDGMGLANKTWCWRVGRVYNFFYAGYLWREDEIDNNNNICNNINNNTKYCLSCRLSAERRWQKLRLLTMNPNIQSSMRLLQPSHSQWDDHNKTVILLL